MWNGDRLRNRSRLGATPDPQHQVDRFWCDERVRLYREPRAFFVDLGGFLSVSCEDVIIMSLLEQPQHLSDRSPKGGFCLLLEDLCSLEIQPTRGIGIPTPLKAVRGARGAQGRAAREPALERIGGVTQVEDCGFPEPFVLLGAQRCEPKVRGVHDLVLPCYRLHGLMVLYASFKAESGFYRSNRIEDDFIGYLPQRLI